MDKMSQCLNQDGSQGQGFWGQEQAYSFSGQCAGALLPSANLKCDVAGG